MSATVAAVLQAVTDLLQPIVGESSALRAAVNGPPDQLNAFPQASVWLGAATVELDPDRGQTMPAYGIYERKTTQTGFVRIYEARRGILPGDFNRLVPPLDAVKTQLATDDNLSGLVERFQATGSTVPGYDPDLESLYLDVGFQAVWYDAGSYPEGWE